MLDDLTEVNALISVTVWGQIGSWVGEAAEHRKMAKDALAGRADAAADRLRRHIEEFQRRVFEALGTPVRHTWDKEPAGAMKETGTGMNFASTTRGLCAASWPSLRRLSGPTAASTRRPTNGASGAWSKVAYHCHPERQHRASSTPWRPERRRSSLGSVSRRPTRAPTVMVGVGHDLASAREAARDAQALGAAMIMIHEPVHPYVSVDGWIEYHRADRELPCPSWEWSSTCATPRSPASAFARLGELCPNVVGVKYAVANPAHFACVAADAGAGRFTWVAGLAELHAPGYFAVGATGFTSGLANVDPATSLGLWRALTDGDRDAAHGDLGEGAALRGAACLQRGRLQRLGRERGALPARDLCA